MTTFAALIIKSFLLHPGNGKNTLNRNTLSKDKDKDKDKLLHPDEDTLLSVLSSGAKDDEDSHP
jgi:hypothetical protein